MHLDSINFEALRKLRLNGETESKKTAFGRPLTIKKINIFIGPNGGGKSTIMDLVRSINNPLLLPTLPRENMRADTKSGFTLRFGDRVTLAGILNKTNVNECGVNLLLYAYGLTFTYQGFFNNNDDNIKNIKEIYNKIPATVSYRNTHNEKGTELSDIVTIMNDERLCLDGLLPTPLTDNQFYYDSPPGWDSSYAEKKPVQIINEKEMLLSLWLNDDCLQSNHVSLEMLPSGWRAFCGLLSWLNNQPNGCICVIEEPETHIHPRLLRKLISRIIKVSEEKDLQLFITTHSSIFMDLNLWDDNDTALFDVDISDVSTLTEPFRLLTNLGVKPSDVSHANGIIWVEGPSDRIYLLHWLDLLCKKHGRKLKENNQFSILTYGGSILSHLTTNDKDNKINIFKVNRNSLVVIDRDLDFKNVNGEPVPVNKNHAKNRIRETVCSIVTDGYTIESYLPDTFFDVYFEMIGGKVALKQNRSKVDIAKKYCNSYGSLNDCFGSTNGIEFIQFIYDVIVKWNT